MQTLKAQIFELLQEVDAPVAYLSTPSGFPAIRYSLIDNYSVRLSEAKHSRREIYQIDVFHQVPIDVGDEDGLLWQIEELLELDGLYTTDWIENLDSDTINQFPTYHYFLTVRR